MSGQLHPVSPDLVPVQPGEIVAFREDHPLHGNTDLSAVDETGEPRPVATVERHAKYGRVVNVGLLDDGSLALDVLVYDPHEGAPAVSDDEEPDLYRARIGELQ